MIGSLAGKIIEKQASFLLLDVQGVGYEIAVSMNTLTKLPDLGQTTTIHTHFIVREDAQLLYGFFDRQERALFKILIKVSGVGPKLALSILSAIQVEDFLRCVYEQDTPRLIKLPGIGKRTAERLMMDLRSKLKDIDQLANAVTPVKKLNNGVSSKTGSYHDALSALVTLGYGDAQARYALSAISERIDSSADMIKASLQIINNYHNR